MYRRLHSPHRGLCVSHLTSFEPRRNLVTPILEIGKQAQRPAAVPSVASGPARGWFRLRFNPYLTWGTRVSWTRVLCENAASTELRLKAGLGVPSLPGAAGMWLGAQQEAQLVCVSKGQPHDRREQCWSPAPCGAECSYSAPKPPNNGYSVCNVCTVTVSVL